MGLFDGMLGNASKIDAAKIQQEFQQILAPGEAVEHAYQLIRDYFVFTNKRFVLVDKQGNFGSIAGLPAAAMRYTEARMSAVASMMMDDLKMIQCVVCVMERVLHETAVSEHLIERVSFDVRHQNHVQKTP